VKISGLKDSEDFGAEDWQVSGRRTLERLCRKKIEANLEEEEEDQEK